MLIKHKNRHTISVVHYHKAILKKFEISLPNHDSVKSLQNEDGTE